VYTTLDMRMQVDALKAMKGILPMGPAGALVSIDPATGFIRAMATTSKWRTTKFNLAWQAHRQLGSAMKPFALVAAVEAGANPATTYYTSRPLHIYLGPGSVPPFWDVATFSNSYAGSINLVHATWQSDNTVFAQLALDLGPRKIVDVAHRMGITSRLRPYPSIVLGTEVVNPLEVADAYATLASEGVRHAPQAIVRVVFPGGRTERARIRGKRVVPAGVAYVVDQILEGNTRFGTAAALPGYYQGVAAGKTGTTSDLVDAWFCGFDPKLATAIWMGYPQAEVAMPGVQGATYCVPIWGTYYELVFGTRPIADFAVPAVLPQWQPWHGHYASLPPSPTAKPTAKPTASPPGSQPTSQPTGSPTGQPTTAP
jgi:penicillin-binding protein 1A